uniref:C-type lectin domain-containing protein n=1 Tax=Nothobranchius furzeri TaxID=105023 RepID=A0A8C6KP82_NOTFU
SPQFLFSPVSMLIALTCLLLPQSLKFPAHHVFKPSQFCVSCRFIVSMSACSLLKTLQKSSACFSHSSTVRDEMNRVLANRTGLENGVWIGLERSMFGTDVNWMWASGSRAENPGWNFSFPVDRWNNHCGKAIWLNESREIKLLDENCHEKLPYICQGELS